MRELNAHDVDPVLIQLAGFLRLISSAGGQVISKTEARLLEDKLGDYISKVTAEASQLYRKLPDRADLAVMNPIGVLDEVRRLFRIIGTDGFLEESYKQRVRALEAKLDELIEEFTPPTVCFGTAEYEDADRFSGEYRTRAEAIASARVEFSGRAFYVSEGRKPFASDFLPDRSDLEETMASSAGDEAGEVTEGWPELPEHFRDVWSLVEAWIDKNVPVPFWIGTGDVERIDALPTKLEIDEERADRARDERLEEGGG